MTYPVLRLGHVASTKTSNVDKKSYDGEVTVRLCNYTDVYKNDTITSDMDFMVATATQDQIDKFGLKVGDTVFTKDSETADDIGVPAYIGDSAHDLVCGYHLAIARPLGGTADPRFLYWCLTSPEAAQQWSVLASGVTRVGLRQADIGKLEIPVPPLQIQREISAFLDRETAQIDALISKQEQLIELLDERRRATINEAYAKEAAPAKLRHVVQFAQTGPFGTQLSAEEYVDDGVPVINPTHIRNGKIVPDLTISVTPGKAGELARHKLMKGDIILGRKGEVDKSARATHESEGFICGSDSMLLRPKTSTDSDYLWWFFQSPEAHAQLELWSVGSTVTGLNQTTMSKIRLPLPSLAEQRAVAHLLTDATRKIDRLIEKTAQSIELLRERRSALISAAVTGKINVTNGGVAA